MSEEKSLNEEAKEFAKEAKEKASEFANDAKKTASEFADEAKEAASEFSEDSKKVLSDGKNVAIIAHLTLIGWVVALVMNNSNQSEFASFYIRQTLGLMLISLVLSFVPFVGWILNLAMLVLWILSLLGALGGEKKLTPVVGAYFQDWFKSL